MPGLRHAVLCVLGGAALLACDQPAEPAPAGSLATTSGVNASVSGSGHITREDGSKRHFTISANRRADGTTTGQYNLVSGSGAVRLHGDVTCLTVIGHRAFVGGTIDRFNLDFGTPLFGVAIELVDNGEGAVAGPDEISNVFFFVNGPEEIQAYCDDHPVGPVMPIDDGNISVN
jgi:hypothetical protein